MTIITDTREQNALPITKAKIKKMELWPGDYSVAAWSRMFAVERQHAAEIVTYHAAAAIAEKKAKASVRKSLTLSLGVSK